MALTSDRVPVIVLSGHLGAGKTTLLNHVLAQPGARLGVVVNDFGVINVDAALITGQVDEAASISGGCLCCLVDDDRLDDALDTLSQPRLRLDAIVVEASGIAEPAALAAIVRSSRVPRVRPGGVVDVVDAVEHLHTVDTGGAPPARYGAASLVVLNKVDLLVDPAEVLPRIEQRIRLVSPDVEIVHASRGQVDPALLFDLASSADPTDQLPFAAAARAERPHPAHQHAAASTATAPGPVEPGRLVDLLEDPPPGAYRLKGRVTVLSGHGTQGFVVNVVGRSVHVAASPATGDSSLVAVGLHLDVEAARIRLEEALHPGDRPDAAGYKRLQQLVRRSR